MSIQPTNKYLMADYREVLGTNDAPQMIDTETSITPVAIVNQGLPKPSNKQKVRYTSINISTTSTYYQIATKAANTKIYLLGFYYQNKAAFANNCTLFDASTGNVPSLSANTAYQEELGILFDDGLATIHQIDILFPLPIEIKQGIRFNGGAANVQATIVIYYLEEQIN